MEGGVIHQEQGAAQQAQAVAAHRTSMKTRDTMRERQILESSKTQGEATLGDQTPVPWIVARRTAAHRTPENLTPERPMPG